MIILSTVYINIVNVGNIFFSMLFVLDLNIFELYRYVEYCLVKTIWKTDICYPPDENFGKSLHIYNMFGLNIISPLNIFYMKNNLEKTLKFVKEWKILIMNLQLFGQILFILKIIHGLIKAKIGFRIWKM